MYIIIIIAKLTGSEIHAMRPVAVKMEMALCFMRDTFGGLREELIYW